MRILQEKELEYQRTQDAAEWDAAKQPRLNLQVIILGSSLTKKKPKRFENTPRRIPTSSIPQFLIWQVDRQGSQKSMDSPNEHF